MAQHSPSSPTGPTTPFDTTDHGADPSWLLPVLGHTLGAATVGGILGGFILRNLLGGFDWFGDWGQTIWFWAVVGAALGGVSGLTRGLRNQRRKRQARQLAAQKALTFSEHGDSAVVER